MNTHKVFNQTPSIDGVNLYQIDQALKSNLTLSNVDWGNEAIDEYGALMGQANWIENGFLTNQNIPVFHSHDEKGRRIDEVRYHPSYHDILELGINHGIHSLPWTEQRKGAHMVRLAIYYMHAQNEGGTGCPLSMTFSCVPAINKYLPQAQEWLPKIISNVYDPANKPYYMKKGLTVGMAMTEKQGGTDVRANTTNATPIGKRGCGELYQLTGHKWFCSAPMCDAFLVLAKSEGGLSCFLFPRWKPDGTKNDFRIQRLKDKLGNRSNASSEIEFEGALAWMMGEEGRGVQTIIEMVAMTRYDCMIGSSALMRRGVTEVLHHIKHREVMGRKLIDQPLMRNVAADLCLESEGAIAITCRAAQCLEEDSAESQLFLRMLLPVGKYWVTKRANVMLAEAMECLGGNGYVEESILPRLYREAPVNAIWEGSGNVQCLDVLRAIQRSPETLEVVINELVSVNGKISDYDRYILKLKKDLSIYLQNDFYARKLTEQLALAIQACQLIKLENRNVAEAFCQARLNNASGWLFGTISDQQNINQILERYHF